MHTWRADPHFVSGLRYTHRHRPYVQSAPDLSVRAEDGNPKAHV